MHRWNTSSMFKKWQGILNEKNHFLTDTDETPFQCEHCDHSFIRKSYLDKHTKMHMKEHSYKCSHCDKIFFQESYLINHSKTHLGEKTYQCCQCEKSFASISDLTKHNRTHTGEKLINAVSVSRHLPLVIIL